MTKKQSPAVIEMTEDELNAFKERVKTKQLTEDDYPIIGQTIEFVIWVQIKLEHAKITMSKFKKLLFGSKTEKNKRSKNDTPNNSNNKNSTEPSTNEPFDKLPDERQSDITNLTSNEEKSSISSPLSIPMEPKIKHKGHGRIAANEYKPDEIIVVTHETLSAGDDCPNACGGKLYKLPVTPGGIIRVKGQKCAHIISFEFHKLRCVLCGATFIPKAPDNFHNAKHDEYFKSILVLSKYYIATPLYRQEHYQKMLGIPLFDSTQWDCIESVADCVYPVFSVLEEKAANCKNINHDDTPIKILDVMRDNKLNPDKERTGMYTTCIIAKSDDYEICLYYNGTKHGGENMAALLAKRDESPTASASDV